MSTTANTQPFQQQHTLNLASAWLSPTYWKKEQVRLHLNVQTREIEIRTVARHALIHLVAGIFGNDWGTAITSHCKHTLRTLPNKQQIKTILSGGKNACAAILQNLMDGMAVSGQKTFKNMLSEPSSGENPQMDPRDTITSLPAEIPAEQPAARIGREDAAQPTAQAGAAIEVLDKLEPTPDMVQLSPQEALYKKMMDTLRADIWQNDRDNDIKNIAELWETIVGPATGKAIKLWEEVKSHKPSKTYRVELVKEIAGTVMVVGQVLLKKEVIVCLRENAHEKIIEFPDPTKTIIGKFLWTNYPIRSIVFHNQSVTVHTGKDKMTFSIKGCRDLFASVKWPKK